MGNQFKVYVSLCVCGRFPGGSVVKNLPANAGDVGLIPELERSPGEGNGNPLRILSWEIPWSEEN